MMCLNSFQVQKARKVNLMEAGQLKKFFHFINRNRWEILANGKECKDQDRLQM